jgi:hypothetical protein
MTKYRINLRRVIPMTMMDFYLSVKEEETLDSVMSKLKKAVSDELLADVPTNKPTSTKKREAAKEVVADVSEEDKATKKKNYAKKFNVAQKHIKQLKEDGIDLSDDDKKKIKAHYIQNDIYELDDSFEL